MRFHSALLCLDSLLRLMFARSACVLHSEPFILTVEWSARYTSRPWDAIKKCREKETSLGWGSGGEIK